MIPGDTHRPDAGDEYDVTYWAPEDVSEEPLPRVSWVEHLGNLLGALCLFLFLYLLTLVLFSFPEPL